VVEHCSSAAVRQSEEDYSVPAEQALCSEKSLELDLRRRRSQCT